MHSTCALGHSCAWSQAHILCASTCVLGPICTWSKLYLVASTHSSWNQGGTQKSSNLGGSFNKIRAGVLILRAPGSFVRRFEKAELNICLSSAWTNLLLQKTYIQREILSTWFCGEKKLWMSIEKSYTAPCRLAITQEVWRLQSVPVLLTICPCTGANVHLYTLYCGASPSANAYTCYWVNASNWK